MSPAPAAPADAALCALCGRPNECAIAAGADTPCWCTQALFTAHARERAASAGDPPRCICARCAGGPAAPGSDAQTRSRG